MTGPTTRPIRDNRPRGIDGRLLDYAASDQPGREPERNRHERYESRNSAEDQPSKREIWAAVLAMVPDRFRPAARLMLGCVMCLLIASLYLIGSVEWHWQSFLWQPRTASAEDLRKTDARVLALEQASAMSLRIQQRQRMMALQDIICRTGDARLSAELDEMQYDYRRLNGREYPLPACPKSQ